MSIKDKNLTSALAGIVFFALASSASALTISTGPVYTLPGGGSCSVSGSPFTAGVATVTCTGVDQGDHTNIYFGIRNSTNRNGNAMDGGHGAGAETASFVSNTATSITYNSTTTINNAIGSSTQAVTDTLVVTRTAGATTVVSTAGTPASNGLGDIERLFRLDSGSSFTFTVGMTSATTPGGPAAPRVAYDAVQTPLAGTTDQVGGVDLAFYTSDCGDGVTDSPEQCDEGAANGTATSCCSSTCTYVSGGTTCRASAGLCDIAEVCSGSAGACPGDTVQPGGTTCRAVAGLCDVAETCNGVSASCPSDGFLAGGTTCRTGSGDSCDATESCTGSAAACPPDDAPTNAGNTCNPGSGDSCDPDETCTGTPGATCPADVVTGAGTTCRAGSGDSCDATETCSGIALDPCPVDDAPTNAGNTCRVGSGDSCDVDETCTGTPGATCPADDAAGNLGTVCNAGTSDVCDPDETCTGIAGATCPGDTVASAGTTCRAGSGDSCDATETCSGIADDPCPADDAPGNSGTVCRAGSGDSCDVDEACTGTPGATCPADDAAGNLGTVCNAGTGDICDPDETCTGIVGATCPSDTVASAGTACRAGSGDSCDATETCSGIADDPCPADDAPTNAGNVCRAGSGDPNGSGFVCDPDETCTGTPGATCPADVVESAGTTCRADAGDCDVEEACSGTAGEACAVDGFEPVGTVCPNSTLCDGIELCDGAGSCLGGPTPDCDDGSACTVDTCDATLGCLNTGAPEVGCITGFQKGILLVNEKNPTKEKVVAKFIKGPALTQTDFGNPLSVGGTAYDMCIFDAAGNLAGSFNVDRAGDLCAGKNCWKKLGADPPNGKGYKFKDKDLTSDGVLITLMKGGAAGKSKILVKGKNKNGTMPIGIAAALQAGVPAGSSATVQFIPDAAPAGSAAIGCFEMELTDVKKNDGVKFKAKQ